MTNHYEPKEDPNNLREIATHLGHQGEEPKEGKFIATLPSLEGIVECGEGKDPQEARADLLENIGNLIVELKQKEYNCIVGDSYILVEEMK